ncbi:MAG: hypothetical protein ABR520_00055 [Mycobacteriales bacterium]|nr:hypothetical protein [Frankia sp.]
MLLVIALAFPLALLVALLAMERVEEPIRHEALGLQLETFLDNARPDELETFVSEGYEEALARYWHRRDHAAD